MPKSLLAAAVALAALAAPAAAQAPVPDLIRLPDGFQPEGIAAGRGDRFYVGSIPTGAVVRGSVRTGEVEPLVAAREGRAAVGIEYERDARRLWVAGGETGEGYVYDARTGDDVRRYRFAEAGAGFVNDVAVTDDAAYFTDSVNPRLYVVPIDRRDRPARPGRTEALELSGDLEYGEGFNANGIDATADGRWLVVVQSNTGMLFRVDPRTGETRAIDLGGESVPRGDGVLLRGRTLYVVQNRLNLVAVISLDARLRSGVLERRLGDPDLDVPTTVALVRGRLYAVNGRFGTPPQPDTRYDVVLVARRP